MANGSAFQLSELSGGVWKLTFDLPGEKVNKFNQKAITDFEAMIPQLERGSGKIQALVVASGKPGNFIAGADINLIMSCKTSDEARALSRAGQKLLDRFEDLPFPTVALIDGPAVGGGCELSLACTAIVASNAPATKIGLPETMLGVIPGMGGCVRMPRKIGLASALEIILQGKALSGERAFKAGLADALVPQENFEADAVAWVKKNLEALKKGERLGKEPKLGGVGGVAGSALENLIPGRMFMLKKARDGVMAKTHGHYPAPLEAIEVIGETGGHYGPKIRGKAREKAMEREAEGFGKMAATEVSKNLIRIFFMTETVKKSKGLPEGVQANSHAVRQGAVLGAGVMGGGIAQLLAEKNVPVRMKDLNTNALALGMTAASRIFKKQAQRRRINQRQYLQKMNLIGPVLDFSGFKQTDLVIEAVIEKMDVKKSVLADLENQVRPDTVLASNTSSLSISEMQKAMKMPERFAGMHFFNPVAKMPLIEVIRGEKSSNEAVSTIFQFSKQLGKTPIVVKDAPGFLVNRLLMPYLNEATWCLHDGAPIDEIDKALLNFGMPMGPMDLIDEVGIDVGEKVAHILEDAFGERVHASDLNGKLVKAQRLGKKNGKGLYEYDAQGRNGKLNSEIYGVLGVQQFLL